MAGRKGETERRSRRRGPAAPDLGLTLRGLEEAQLLRRADEEDPAYLFKHTLTQESAYDSLLLKTRRTIHRQVAEAYERLYPSVLDELAPYLAQHYDQAGDEAKTLEYAVRAAAAAARRYANVEANAFYTRAIELARNLGEWPKLQELYLRRGRVLELSGRYPLALSVYEEMQREAERREDRRMKLAAMTARAILLATPTQVSDKRKAEPLLDEALGLARELADRKAEAKILWIHMLLDKLVGRPEQGRLAGQESLRIAREENLTEQLAYTLNDMATHNAMDLGEFTQAVEFLKEGRQLWEQLGNEPMLADNLGSSAMMNTFLGEYDQALQAADAARQISERIGNLWGQSYSRFAVGDVYFDRGEVSRALDTMEQCIRLAAEAGFTAPAVFVRTNLALAYGQLGAIEKGIELARQAVQSAGVELRIWREKSLAGGLARLELFRGALDEAERLFAEAGVDLDRAPAHYGELSRAPGIWYTWIELQLARGRPAVARRYADDLLRVIELTSTRAFRPEALWLRGRTYEAEAELDRAREDFLAARAAAEQLGSRRMLWQIDAALARIESRCENQEQAAKYVARARENLDFIILHTPPELREDLIKFAPVAKVLQASTA